MTNRFIPLKLGLLTAAILLSTLASASADVLIVTKRSVGFSHFTSIQDAVNEAERGDFILIEPGKYRGPVMIKKSGIHIRGMNRNAVIVDGNHQKGVNGIEVFKANNVSIENLTVRNFDRPTVDGDNGNQIWWNGGDGSGVIGMRGWRGRFLTTYSTGLLGGYGIFISNAVSGSLRQAYASGFNDSGIYLGACRDCRAHLSDMLVERNALGYSGTNSGGRIILEDSIFRNNSNGIGPNSLNNDDRPPPQNGACSSGSNRSVTPIFPTTRIARCTIFRNNLVERNGNLSTPANSTTGSIPWGNGFVLVGTYADLITDNTIRNNPNNGLLGFENPDPFPPTPNTIFFQLSGNKVTDNIFRRNGSNIANNPFAGDIAIEGGLFGMMMSTNNCFEFNRFRKSFPANIEGRWNCRHRTTPNAGGDMLTQLLALESQSLARKSVPQPIPPAQPTMPNPCRGVPRNPICRRS